MYFIVVFGSWIATMTSSLTKKTSRVMKGMLSQEKLLIGFSIKSQGSSSQVRKIKWATKISSGSCFQKKTKQLIDLYTTGSK